jgi:predicted AlkP superfamily pyrophosphatase or phosphodiesterase
MTVLDRRSALRALARAALALAAACAPARAAAQETPHVVLISIDGLRPDAIDAAGARTLQRMIREGASATRARTIVPSRTLPSHTSMLTGVQPAVHGITWNFEQVDNVGTVKVPTVFDLAQAAGKTTAGFFGKPKFRHLLRRDAPRFRMAPSGYDVWAAPRIAQEVQDYLRHRKPDFTFVHIADPDVAGHSIGWMSAPYRFAVRRADNAVRIIAQSARRAFGDNFVIIVTADHGGHGRDHGTERDADMNIPWIAWGKRVRTGPIPGEVNTTDSAATVLWLLGVPRPADWTGRPVEAAFTATR